MGTGADETAEQVNDLFDALELSRAVETEEFRNFLDHVPIAIVVSKFFRGDQRICYANKTFEALLGRSLAELTGRSWSVLANFKDERDTKVSLYDVLLSSTDEFLGTFCLTGPKSLTFEAYSGLIENEDGSENYRIAALIDVTDRARAEREDFIRRLRDKDILLKEVQHRVKNNLQLVIALIRLEARNKGRDAEINLPALAGRIESLQLLYQALSPNGWGDDVDLGHYLNQIAAAVMNSYATDGIRLDIKVDHTPIPINVAVSLGLVVNELLTNSFKYAFVDRGQGTITIECLRHDEDRYRIVVGDDGVGLPPGLVWPVPGKIGALIVQTLRENTQAEFNIETAPGMGVRATISFSHRVPLRPKN
jgi:PAS domain S-box-containing protein